MGRKFVSILKWEGKKRLCWKRGEMNPSVTEKWLVDARPRLTNVLKALDTVYEGTASDGSKCSDIVKYALCKSYSTILPQAIRTYI